MLGWSGFCFGLYHSIPSRGVYMHATLKAGKALRVYRCYPAGCMEVLFCRHKMALSSYLQCFPAIEWHALHSLQCFSLPSRPRTSSCVYKETKQSLPFFFQCGILFCFYVKYYTNNWTHIKPLGQCVSKAVDDLLRFFAYAPITSSTLYGHCTEHASC